MQGSAVENMRKFYGEEVAAPTEWIQWQTVLGLTANGLLESIVKEAGALGSEIETGISNSLIQTGSYLLGDLPDQLIQLLPLLKEKLAAQELRTRFGEPLSLLAVPVFMDLTKMDVEADLSLQNTKGQIVSLVENMTQQIVGALQLFIAERVNSVENEIKMHDAALSTSSQISSETAGGLEDEMARFKPQFDVKKESLKSTRKSLYDLLHTVTGMFGNLTQQSQAAPVINSIEQSTGPVLRAA